MLLGDTLDTEQVAAALPVSDCDELLVLSGSGVRCPVEVAPHADDDCDWWVVSDRTDARGRPKRSDHVLGVGGASATLAQLTVRRLVGRALDIGTGCGVQALHLSRHSSHVTATDVMPRALRLAATTFALSGVEVDLVEGDLVAGVPDRSFDLVVCNPPFVVGPAPRFAYRDAGRDLDDISREVVQSAASVLVDGGVAQLLVNVAQVRGEDWRDRFASWVVDLECDAWLVQRDVQDPVDYVSTWSTDVGDYDDERADEWLRWMQERDVEAIGFGWVLMRRSTAPHHLAAEEVLHPVDQPLGPDLAEWLDRVAWLRTRDDDELLATALSVAPDVRHDVARVRTAHGWDPAGQALRLDRGLRFRLPCDDATAALVAGCDGATPLARLASVLAASLGEAPAAVAAAVAATARGLVERGLLLPPPA
ncbi:MAG TPA: methyltransferase [Mycobacteriales bacterium]|nr:methyltransferase [Mycobacteriales bacterium]